MNPQEEISAEVLSEDLKQFSIKDVLKKHQHQIIPSKVLYDLFNMDPTWSTMLLFLASYPNTPSRLLERMFDETADEAILMALAAHARTSNEIRQQLATHNSCRIRETVAASRFITPKTANVLARDSLGFIRCVLAENPDLYQRLQLELADDPESWVKVALALNKNPIPLLTEKLMKDDDPFVKIALATKANLQSRDLLAIADSEDLIMQTALLGRDNLPDEILESLSFSTHPSVSTEALSRKALSPDEILGWALSDDLEKQKLVATLDDIPEPVQEVIAEKTDQTVLETLAANPHISEKAALLLINQNNRKLNLILAENCGIASSIIAKLCMGNNPDICKTLALRGDLTDEHYHILINQNQDLEVIYHLVCNQHTFSGITRPMTRKLIYSENPSLRALGALSTELDTTDLPRLSYDPSINVKINLIGNPNITYKVLHFLGSDPNEAVSRQAKQKLAEMKQQQESIENQQQKPQEFANQDALTPKIIKKFLDKLKGL